MWVYAATPLYIRSLYVIPMLALSLIIPRRQNRDSPREHPPKPLLHISTFSRRWLKPRRPGPTQDLLDLAHDRLAALYEIACTAKQPVWSVLGHFWPFFFFHA